MNGVTLLMPTLILIHQNLGHTLYMLVKRKKVFNKYSFKREKRLDTFNRCVGCNLRESHRNCKRDIIDLCDKANIGMHNYSGKLLYNICYTKRS